MEVDPYPYPDDDDEPAWFNYYDFEVPKVPVPDVPDIPHKSVSEATCMDLVSILVDGNPTTLKELLPIVMKVQGRRCAFYALFQLYVRFQHDS